MNFDLKSNWKGPVAKLVTSVFLFAACLTNTHAFFLEYIEDNTGYYTPFTNGGNIFDEGARLGMWANSGGTAKEVVAWRTFKTAGDNSGSDRSLQVGDVFSITLNAASAFGGMGFSLNDNGSTGSYANRVSGSRLFVQEVGTTASWEVNSASGSGGYTTLDYNVGTTRRDYVFKVYITSETTANVLLTEGSTDKRAYNLTMNGTAGANIDAFSVWLKDDWNGSSAANLHVANISVEDLGFVEVGYWLASGTTDPGKITDGLVANNTSTVRANEVRVGGDSGSAVLLNQENSYTGATIINAAATARASHASAFGTTAGGVSVTSGGMLELSGGITVGSEALTLNGTGMTSYGALRNTSGNNIWQGAVTLGSASRINSDGGTLTLDVASGNGITGTHNLTLGGAGSVEVKDPIATSTGTVTKDGSGTLTLAGNNTYSGETLLNNGTILVGNNGAFGTGTMTINHDTGSGTRSLASSSASNFTLNNNFNLYFNSFTLGQTSGGTGSLTLGGSGKNFYLGNDASTANRVITVNGNHEIAAAVTGGANNHIVKQGSGQLTLSGANTSTGNIYIDSGTVNLSGGSLGAGNIDLGGGSANNSINSDNAILKVTSGSFSRPITVNAETTSGGASGSRAIEFANTSGTATLSGTVGLEKTATVSVASGGIGGLSGVISGTGGLTKSGAGMLTISGASANTYTGNTTVNGGTFKLEKTAGINAIASGTIAIQQGTLLLGAANQIGDNTGITMSGGTLDTAGYADAVGKLTVSANSTIQGLNSTSGSAFTFSDIDLGNYSTAGSTLTLLPTSGTYSQGTVIQLSSVAASSWSGYSATSLNNFSSKISFSDANLMAQINFGGGTSGTTLTVAAIPEPRVYAAAAGLVLLIGWAEFKRRRGKKLGVSR
jgi:autotransporter-associated beta strand protein